MRIETKYNYRDIVYPISTRFETLKVSTNCPACKDKGKVELNGNEYTCPKCRGYTYHEVEGDIEYYVTFSQGKIGKIDINLYDPKYEGKYGNISEIRYMLDSTGIGSGTVWEEDNLFKSRDEAQIECDRRNVALKIERLDKKIQLQKIKILR